jgi:hypothetical protein
MIDPTAPPLWGTALSTARKDHQARRLEVVEQELWPDGVPKLEVSVRNRMVADRFVAKGWSPLSVRHLQRLHGGR